MSRYDRDVFWVDLDNQGRRTADPRGKDREDKRSNIHRVEIKPATTINLAVLDAYLSGRADFGTPVLEAISKQCVCSTTHVYANPPRFSRSPFTRNAVEKFNRSQTFLFWPPW